MTRKQNDARIERERERDGSRRETGQEADPVETKGTV